MNEEGVLAALRARRAELVDPLLARHGGRIANTAGDSLLVEFPSAVEAVRWALALQQGMHACNTGLPEDKHIVYRIGINIGDVVAEGDDLLGDGVNVAARLEGLCPPGGILLSRSVRDMVHDRLELRLADLGEVAVKNIVRPVRIFQVLGDDEAPIPTGASAQLKWRRTLAFSAAIVAALAGGAWWWFAQRPEYQPADPAKLAYAVPTGPSIAVMPFETLGPEGETDLLGVGLAGDITQALSRFADLTVISTESMKSYVGSGTPLRQVAEEMGIRHVLAGSVERAGDRLRIGVRLVDALSGQLIWSDSLEEEGDDIFAIRDEVSRAVAIQLGAEASPLAAAWLAPSKRKEVTNLGAYELYLQAKELQHRRDKADNARSQDLLKRALSLDPLYARAWVGLAWAHAHDVWNGWSASPEQSMNEAIESAERAIEIDPLLSDGYWVLASVSLCFADEQAKSVELYRKALELNPNSPDTLAEWGGYNLPPMFPEQADEGIAMVERAMRLNPRHADWYDGALVSAFFSAKRPQEAIQAFSTVEYPAFNNRAYLAASYGHVGDVENGRKAINELLKLRPDFNLRSVMTEPEVCPKGTSAAGMQYLRAGLEKAGLPP